VPESKKKPRAPLSDAIIVSVAKLVADAQGERRDPSHSDLEFQIKRSGLSEGDPVAHGQTAGKAKRIRAVLTWALDNSPAKGEELVAALVGTVRGCGGFRPDSPSFVGKEALESAISSFKEEGFQLSMDGVLIPTVLDNLSGADLTQALQAYVQRAKRGVEDAALLVGTGKDLLEAVAKHVIISRMNVVPKEMDFPTLLGQAFYALDMATPADAIKPGEHPRRRLERSLYEAGCAVNALRNREGTGHGRPWLSSVKDEESRMAVEVMGVVGGYMLRSLKTTN